MSRWMDHRTAYSLDRINKIYRIEEQDAGLSLCIRPASTPHSRPICKYLTIHPPKIKFSQSLSPDFSGPVPRFLFKNYSCWHQEFPSASSWRHNSFLVSFRPRSRHGIFHAERKIFGAGVVIVREIRYRRLGNSNGIKIAVAGGEIGAVRAFRH